VPSATAGCLRHFTRLRYAPTIAGVPRLKNDASTYSLLATCIAAFDRRSGSCDFTILRLAVKRCTDWTFALPSVLSLLNGPTLRPEKRRVQAYASAIRCITGIHCAALCVLRPGLVGDGSLQHARLKDSVGL